jgi:hypothetical protein
MTATGTPASNIKAFFRNGPIRWLVIGGAVLIAAITIGTTIMAGNFRERALTSRERELTVLLLARQFRSTSRRLHDRRERSRRTNPVDRKHARNPQKEIGYSGMA